MKIISEQLIRSLKNSPKECVAWIYERFAMNQDVQLPAKISVHPADYDFFTSMPCLLPESGGKLTNRYFGIKEVHRIERLYPLLVLT